MAKPCRKISAWQAAYQFKDIDADPLQDNIQAEDIFEELAKAAEEQDQEKTTELVYKLKKERIRIRRAGRLVTISKFHKKHLDKLFPRVPTPKEDFHIVSCGQFDFFTWVAIIIDRLGGRVEEFWGSTWTMNSTNVNDLIALYDAGKIENIWILTGLYFKRRETAVFARLIEALKKRRQHFIATENHAKIMLFKQKKDYIVIEGSANFTANPRVEQYCMFNSQELYEFHKEWMSEIFTEGRKLSLREEADI